MICKQGWLFYFLFPSCVFAANGHIYLGATIGASMAGVGNSNFVINYYHGDLTDAYPVAGRQATTAMIGINSGYEFINPGSRLAIALGLGIYDTPGDYNYNGQLQETARGDQSSILYNYKYHASSSRLMLETTLSWMLDKWVPFINMGVGPAWNHMSGYTESPIDSSGYVALPPFRSGINTNFAYQLGFGVAYGFDVKPCFTNYQHERISLLYRYASLGSAAFGTRGAVYPYRLDMGQLTSNELSFSYTHLF